MKAKFWIAFSGLLWMLSGASLLYKGLSFCALCVEKGVSPERALLWIGIALFIGYLKKRFVFAKSTYRLVTRLQGHPGSIGFWQAFPFSYWATLLSMLSLGFFLRLVPLFVRGVVDVAVGSALLLGAQLYFAAARRTVTE